jgi:glycosyltransferase involved in cell wall biosynthesis
MATFAVGMLSSRLTETVALKAVRVDQVNKLAHRGLTRRCLNVVNAAVLSVVTVWRIVTWWPRIVHIQSNSGPGFGEKAFLGMLARAFGRKVVLHVHGGSFRDYYDRQAAPGRWWIRRGLDVAHRIVCATPRMVETFHLAGVAEEKLVLVGNGVTAPPHSIWEQPGRPDKSADDELTVLFLNRVTEAKGVCELIDAVAGIAPRFPRLRVRIVGFPSSDQPTFEQRVAARGLDAVVTFAGGVDDQDKDAEYRSADIYVLPSHVEDLPYGMLEAMSHGLPCIASDVGGIGTLTEHGASGRLVPPKDVDALAEAMEDLLNDAACRRQLGQAARERIISEYSWDHRGLQIAELYRILLAGHSSASD